MNAVTLEAAIAQAVRPTIAGIVDRHSKDHFDLWVDGVCRDISRAASDAMHSVKSDQWAIDGSIYENMEACLRLGDSGTGRTVAHFHRYADAIEVLAALTQAQGIDARSGETERLDPKGESPVAKPCAQGDL